MAGLVAAGAAHGQPARPPAPAAPPAPRDATDIARIEQALNGIRTLRARFTQISPGNAVARGRCWLWRPGRMRFEYDPPAQILLVAGNGFVSFHDRQINQVSHVPINSTPLQFLLRERVTLTGDVTVTRFERPASLLEPTLVRTGSPAEGSLTVSLSDNPLALRGWRVVDAQGQETRIQLTDIELGGTFERSLFDFVDPNFFRDRPREN